ncbi:hypothetical protein [Streptomyces sp. NPDC001774]
MSSTRDLPGQRLAAGPDDADDWDAGTAPAGVLRNPPQSLEAEQAVLGTLMSSTGASARYFAGILETGITAGDYYPARPRSDPPRHL